MKILQLWNKFRVRALGGFSLIEVMVAMGIFSMAVSVIFVMLSQTHRTKKAGKEYLHAVLLVDNFLNERKLKKDSTDYFFQKDDLADIVKGNVLEGDYQGKVVASTNDGTEYLINCSSSLLFTQPLCYRGLVKCSWKSFLLKKTNNGNFKVATIFVMSNYAAK